MCEALAKRRPGRAVGYTVCGPLSSGPHEYTKLTQNSSAEHACQPHVSTERTVSREQQKTIPTVEILAEQYKLVDKLTKHRVQTVLHSRRLTPRLIKENNTNNTNTTTSNNNNFECCGAHHGWFLRARWTLPYCFAGGRFPPR